jgi:hypothetical protein
MLRINALSLLIVLTLGLAGTVHADDELLRNGDFSRGKSGWKGEGKVTEDDKENKYIEIRVDAKDILDFYQEDLDVKNVKDLVLTFRYKTSADYSGRGFQLEFVRPTGGFTYRTVSIQSTPEWKSYTWNFARTKDSDELTLRIKILEGDGEIMFDDFSVTAK